MTVYVDPVAYGASAVPVTSGGVRPDDFNVNIVDAIKALKDLLDGTEEHGADFNFQPGAGFDFIATLGDAAGADKISVLDSALAEVASINSDGDLNIEGVATIVGLGTGGITDYDLSVGDTDGTPTYGIIRMGNSIIGRTSYSAGSIDLDGTMIFRNVGGPVTSEIDFVFVESGGTSTRFALPVSGVGNATYNSRSMLMAGPAPADTDYVKVSYWQGQGIFDNLVCDTDGDGADVGVQNDLEVEGDIFVDSILESTVAAGVTVDGVPIKDGEISLSFIGNPTGDKTFAMANKTLTFTWVAPTGEGFELEAAGGFTGDLVHIHQASGNPGETDLLHLEAEDPDVHLLHLHQNSDIASHEMFTMEGNRATPTNDDELWFAAFLSDANGNQTEIARTSYVLTDITFDSEDAKITWDIAIAAVLTEAMSLTSPGDLNVLNNITLGGTVDGVDVAARDHAKYTNAEAITAVEGEVTLVLAGDVSIASGKDLTLISGTVDFSNVNAAGLNQNGTGAEAFISIDWPNLTTEAATIRYGRLTNTSGAMQSRWHLGDGSASLGMRLTHGTGRLDLPVTGSGGGLLLGGDAQIYRSAANNVSLASGDAFVILGGAGDFGVPVNGMLWYNTTSGKLRVYESGAWQNVV